MAHAESVNCYAEPVQVIGLTTHAVELCLPDWLREGEANVTAVISSELDSYEPSRCFTFCLLLNS